jgi:protein AbiQ
MEFHRLAQSFFDDYKECPEILTKQSRPYYVLLLTLDEITYAIPLRSHIQHPHCFLADGKESGLDFSKALVITDRQKYVDTQPVTIRQKEFSVFKRHEYEIQKQFARYIALYKKEIARRKHNTELPPSAFCRYSPLKYFHAELGLQ